MDGESRGTKNDIDLCKNIQNLIKRYTRRNSMEEIKKEDLKMIHYPTSNSEIKREYLESHYIRDWDYNKKYRRIKPLDKETPKYYRKVSQEESNKRSQNYRYFEL